MLPNMVNTYNFPLNDRLIRNTEVIFCFSAPFLIATPPKSEFTAGENATLYCSYVSPNSVQMYYFYLNDSLVSSSQDPSVFKPNLNPQDSGSYTCKCGLDLTSTPKSNVVSFTVVGKLTILISFQSPRQKYPLK